MIQRLINTSDHNDLGAGGGWLGEAVSFKVVRDGEKISQAELSRHQSKELSRWGW